MSAKVSVKEVAKEIPSEQPKQPVEEVKKDIPSFDKCDDDEAIEFEIPRKGKMLKIVLGDPGVSVLKLLKTIFGNKENDFGTAAMAMLYIRQIGEDIIDPLSHIQDIEYLMAELGNRGLLLVLEKWNKHFNFNADDIAVTKKNLR